MLQAALVPGGWGAPFERLIGKEVWCGLDMSAADVRQALANARCVLQVVGADLPFDFELVTWLSVVCKYNGYIVAC
jgi:hypothetical protein